MGCFLWRVFGGGAIVPDCCSVVFKRANHRLYLDHSTIGCTSTNLREFSGLLVVFVLKGKVGRAGMSEMD